MGAARSGDKRRCNEGTMMAKDDCTRSTRRDALRLIAGSALLSGAPTALAAPTPAPSPGCVLTPEQTEGPFFVDEHLERADIRSDPGTGALTPGVVLRLDLGVATVDATRCMPLWNAVVDIWQCDALGRYSAVDANGSARFLRGYQVTDANGRVRFTTIYPGAYPGRTVHIHFKVRTLAAGRNAEFTSQFYFDDALTDRVHGAPPYAATGQRRMRNPRDGLYRDGGSRLMLDVDESDGALAATYDIGVRIG